ncbi:MAG: hypothetical protein U1F25_03300 [Rubrivivax sp.]
MKLRPLMPPAGGGPEARTLPLPSRAAGEQLEQVVGVLVGDVGDARAVRRPGVVEDAAVDGECAVDAHVALSFGAAREQLDHVVGDLVGAVGDAELSGAQTKSARRRWAAPKKTCVLPVPSGRTLSGLLTLSISASAR